MAIIKYTLSKKIKCDLSEIILDIQPKRGIHYRVKTGITITPANFERLTATAKITTYDCLYSIEKELYKALPCDKATAEHIIAKCKGVDENLLSVFSAYADSRIIEKGLTEGTREVYYTTLNVLKSYDSVSSVKQIDHKWMTGLITHMCEAGMSNITQGNYYRIFRTFLTHCVNEGMIDASILQYKPKFKTIENEVVYLSSGELQAIYEVILDQKSSVVRDIFVVQCLTGLRYSDMINIYKENIQEDDGGKYITLTTKKTLKRLKIYFNDRADHILSLYDYTLPHPNLSKMDRYLPHIAKQAGIKGRIERVKMVGSKRIVEHKEKWELIKTHTARRTFITLMLDSGQNIATIRSITGHSQLSSFSRYIAVSDKKKSTAVKGLDW